MCQLINVNRNHNDYYGNYKLSENYNVYCYADDLLLSSTTVSGLQKLINIANANITRNGLTFNPQKTECLLVGGNPFTETPQWYMDGASLNIVDKITFGNYHW